MTEQTSQPSQNQRALFTEMLSLALIAIRHLDGIGQARQAADLADVFHEVPREVLVRGVFSWERLYGAAKRYRANYQWEMFAFDHVKMFDEIKRRVVSDNLVVCGN
ncbi:hypothetical protein [Capsulimonas corticalis]|uniref:hypothetical protein n=1 Tax=Capsulimonas corticalis TaxID=2219043 RepID=UPI000E6521D9|nr:hypothetical protein [Capsulimonas corticalis]